MVKYKIKLILLVSIFVNTTLSAISIVYNFRIAQITKRAFVEHEAKTDPFTITFLPFEQYQEKYQGGIRESFTGSLGAFVYDFAQSSYFRTDSAISYINQKAYQETIFSDMQTDDILFTVGHNFSPTNRSKVTFSGLFGIPTHQIYALQHAALGYGQIGTGLQLDGLHRLTNHLDFLWGTRYLYFVPQIAKDANENSYTFSIGNIADILLGLKRNWQSKHSLEGGYTARWDFGAHISPHFDDITAKTNYSRNSFYLVYKYKFETQRVLHRLLFDIGYGFDSKNKKYGYKRIATCWISWSINF